MKKLLTFIAFSFFLSFANAEDWQPIAMSPFGGLNNRDDIHVISANRSTVLQNFDVSPGGKSIKRRKGSLPVFGFTPSTSPIHNLYLFYDASGSDVSLFFHERKIEASISGAATSTIYSTAATNQAVYDCADYLGYAYCANSGRDALFRTQGSLVSSVSTIVSTGTMVAACPTRLAMAGFSGTAASRIDFSAEADILTWGTGSLGTSATPITINAPGSRITHIVYAFGRLLWFKESSFGYIIIGNQPAQADWVIKTVSNNIGTLDNSSTVDPQGNVYFRGQDKRIYRFDGNEFSEFSTEIPATISNSTQTATEQAYLNYFDNKLWVSLAFGPAQTTNNRCLIYDFLSEGWTIYDIGANGFLTRNNQLYIGSSTAAIVGIFGSTTTVTDGVAGGGVFWQSKYFFGDNPFKSFDLVNISVIGDGGSVTSSTITVSYIGAGCGLGSFDFSFGRKSGQSLYVNKLIAPLSSCRDLSIAISEFAPSNVGASGLEIYAVQAGIRPRSWRPEP